MDPSAEASLERQRSLVVAIRRGDRSAWGRLYEELAPLLYRRVLMPRLSSSTLAEDALAETFRTAIERIDQFEDQGSGIYPWLARIAHNKAIDIFRARRADGQKVTDLTHFLEPLTTSVPGADELLELGLESHAMKERIQEALERTNPRYATAIRLRYFEEKSREDCAAALEVKVGTFDVILLRAVRAFATALTGKKEST